MVLINVFFLDFQQTRLNEVFLHARGKILLVNCGYLHTRWCYTATNVYQGKQN